MPSGIQKNRSGLKKFGLRRCTGPCGIVYPLGDDYFYRSNTKNWGGFGWKCKNCKRKDGRKYYGNTRLKTRFEFLKKYNFTCQYCGRKAPEVQFHIDHILPVSKGGSKDESNLILACDECNIGKGNILI